MVKKKSNNARIFQWAAIGIVAAVIGFFIFLKADSSLPVTEDVLANVSSQSYESKFFIAHATTYPYSVNVYNPEDNSTNSSVGISGDKDKLDFSSLPTNASTTKWISVNNKGDTKAKIILFVTGNGKDHIRITPQETYLMPNEEKQIEITLQGGTTPEHYRGNVHVYVITSKPGIPTFFMQVI